MNEEKKKALKAQFGEIHRYKAKDKECYLRNPNLDDIEYAQSVSKTNLGFKRALVNVLWIEGDEELRGGVKYGMGLFGLVSELIEIEIGTLEKL